jgi:hypothetical protein
MSLMSDAKCRQRRRRHSARTPSERANEPHREMSACVPPVPRGARKCLHIVALTASRIPIPLTRNLSILLPSTRADKDNEPGLHPCRGSDIRRLVFPPCTDLSATRSLRIMGTSVLETTVERAK